MTPARLAALRDAERAASSPAPWEADDDGGVTTAEGFGIAFMHPHANIRTVQRTGSEFCRQDQALLVAARNALPDLLDALERAHALLREAREMFVTFHCYDIVARIDAELEGRKG